MARTERIYFKLRYLFEKSTYYQDFRLLENFALGWSELNWRSGKKVLKILQQSEVENLEPELAVQHYQETYWEGEGEKSGLWKCNTNFLDCSWLDKSNVKLSI